MHSTPMPLMSVRSSLAFSCSLVMGDTSVLWFWVLWPQARALELSDKIRDMASKPDARLQAYADMMKAAQG